jgi:hypothetical protein
MKTADAGDVYRTSSEALTATTDEREELGRRSAAKIERRKERYRLATKDKLNFSEAAAIR